MYMKRPLFALMTAAGLLSVMVSVPVAAGTKPSMTETVPSNPATTDPVVKPLPTSTEATPKTEGKTIVDIASSNDSFKTLTAALKAAGLEETLSGDGPFTVFAPTDRAFANLPAGTVERLLKPENKAQLVKVLTYHVVPGTVLSKDLKSGEVKTVEGSPVEVSVKMRSVMVNNAKVTKPDVKASNGVIHAVDRVIIPPDMTGSSQPTEKKPATAPVASPKPATPDAMPASPGSTSK
jgi:uncharacterized surface protein with fasciclin (FAS1) repeats